MVSFGRPQQRPVKKSGGRLQQAKARDTRYDDDDDEDDEEPEVRRPAKAAAAKKSGGSKVASGWAGASRVSKAASDPNAPWRADDGVNVIYILPPGAPVASWNEHWLERPGDKKGEVRRTSVTCIEEVDDRGCPLCDHGVERRPTHRINVAVLTPDNTPQFALYAPNEGVRKWMEEQAKSLERKGGLSGRYMEVTKSGAGFKTRYQPALIRSESSLEDFDIEPLTDEEIKALTKKCRAPEDFENIFPSYKTVLETAREYTNTDDDDEDED